MSGEGSEASRVLALLFWACVLVAGLVCVVLANQNRALAVELQRLADATVRAKGEQRELALENESQLWRLLSVEHEAPVSVEHETLER